MKKMNLFIYTGLLLLLLCFYLLEMTRTASSHPGQEPEPLTCDCEAQQARLEYLEQRVKEQDEIISDLYAEQGESAVREQASIIERNNESNLQYLREWDARIRETAKPSPCH